MTPKLALSSPEPAKGLSAILPRSRSAISIASPIRVSGSTTANSSPPQRAGAVGLADGLAYPFGEFREHAITDLVAVLVVDILEMVDVHHDQGSHLVVAVAAAADGVLEWLLLEGPPVREAGEGGPCARWSGAPRPGGIPGGAPGRSSTRGLRPGRRR